MVWSCAWWQASILLEKGQTEDANSLFFLYSCVCAKVRAVDSG